MSCFAYSTVRSENTLHVREWRTAGMNPGFATGGDLMRGSHFSLPKTKDWLPKKKGEQSPNALPGPMPELIHLFFQ